ncbi:coiled-coil domain-containing protein 88B-like, partial [Piliocolobus tephrosceles]|uniref:coiled-coil domain-containing protein 88B-like n=1 Tax=Piliocolobus tephrosceles TaxID=591936 RepID=UPI000E6AF033
MQGGEVGAEVGLRLPRPACTRKEEAAQGVCGWPRDPPLGDFLFLSGQVQLPQRDGHPDPGMEGGKGPRLRDFLSGSLATWALGLARLVGEAEESEGEEEEEEEEPPLWLEKRFLRLSDGALLLRVLGIIAPSSRGGPRMLRGLDGPAAWRVWNLSHLWSRLRDFYQEELQLLILSPPPDLQTLGFDPLSEEAVEQLEGVLRLLLGASVQCEHRELFIHHIQGLSLEVQSELAAAIQEVTQPGTGVVLALSGPEPGELTPAELEMLSRSLMGTLSRLARERDLGAQVGAAGASWTQVGKLEDHQGAGCAREMEVWGPGMGL